jgi:hypothetical protein
MQAAIGSTVDIRESNVDFPKSANADTGDFMKRLSIQSAGMSASENFE